jgi:hypothetical protein
MLTLARAPKRNDSQYSDEGYGVFNGDRCVGHIVRTHQAPEGAPWFWTITAARRGLLLANPVMRRRASTRWRIL